MPYIGNTIRAADDYRLIDDISSSFNGSTTSFALQVAGSAPVPFPKSPQQILISVNGVIQEPDPTGASGFNLVGTNIVFSSAPTNGHAFFGIIYATADYLNSGGNFPTGSLGAPSITFVGDEDTGIYRKGSGSVAFVANSTEIANTDSNGITISSGDLILGDNRKAKFGASDDLQIFHDGSNSYIEDSGTGNLIIKSDGNSINFRSPVISLKSADNTKSYLIAYDNAAVELYHNNSKKFETTSAGVAVTGQLTTTANIASNADASEISCGADRDFKISHSGSENILRSDFPFFFRNAANNETLVNFNVNGSVELFYDNSKKFETYANGVRAANNGHIKLASDSGKFFMGAGDDAELFHDGTNLTLNGDGTNDTFLRAKSGENSIKLIPDGGVELYHNNGKKFETTSTGVQLVGNLDTNGGAINLPDSNGTTNRISVGTGSDLKILHDGSNSYFASNDLRIVNNALSETQAVFVANGAVELYYDNSKKLETFASGVRWTGQLQCPTAGDNIQFTGANSNAFLIGMTSGADSPTGSDEHLQFHHWNGSAWEKTLFFQRHNITIPDNNKVQFGDGADLQIYHNGSVSRIQDAGTGGLQIITNSLSLANAANSESMIVANENAAVELYYDNSKKLETASYGFKSQGSGEVDVVIGSTNAGGAFLVLDGDSNGDASGGDYATIGHNTAGILDIHARNPAGNAEIQFRTQATHRASIDSSGHLTPAATNTYDLGTSSLRWRNIYTNDLNLSNEGGANDVDGTWGNYTIQEGAEDLFLINKRNGKKYKFALTEVS